MVNLFYHGTDPVQVQVHIQVQTTSSTKSSPEVLVTHTAYNTVNAKTTGV